MLDVPHQLEVFPTAIDLKRIDPALNMRRFYRMSVQRDLFGGACLIREWGRIGFRGQQMVGQHADEGLAVNALMILVRAKMRRGYRLTHTDLPRVFQPAATGARLAFDPHPNLGPLVGRVFRLRAG